MKTKLPAASRGRLRTSNTCERPNRQIRRRERVAGLFPGEASALRLATAIPMEIPEEWETGRRHLPLPGAGEN